MTYRGGEGFEHGENTGHTCCIVSSETTDTTILPCSGTSNNRENHGLFTKSYLSYYSHINEKGQYYA